MVIERINVISLIAINDPQPSIYRGEILGSILYSIGRPVPLIN